MNCKFTKLSVIQLSTGKEIAVVTDKEVTAATSDIVVKLTPDYKEKD